MDPVEQAARAAWDAYAREHFKLADTKPTELELAGMVKAMDAAMANLVDYVRAAAGEESVLITIAQLNAFSDTEAHKLRRRIFEAVVNVMQLDQLRRLHEERTELKLEVRQLRALMQEKEEPPEEP